MVYCCFQNQIYIPPRDQSTCCGVCKNISCIYEHENGTAALYKVRYFWKYENILYFSNEEFYKVKTLSRKMFTVIFFLLINRRVNECLIPIHTTLLVHIYIHLLRLPVNVIVEVYVHCPGVIWQMLNFC